MIWALPEAHETPADLFAAGFLPSNHQFERFYLCRQLRVDLRKFTPSSENRRVLRKGEGIDAALVPRAEFESGAVKGPALQSRNVQVVSFGSSCPLHESE